jgi:cell division protease FtsH
MSERPTPPPPGGAAPKGFFGRNPILIILFILAGVLMLNIILGQGGAAPIDYSAFWSEAARLPVVRAQVYDPTQPLGPEEEARTAEAKKAFIKMVVRPTDIQGEVLWERVKDKEGFKGKNFENLVRKDYLPFSTETPGVSDDLIRDLRARGIDFKVEKPTDWTGIWLWVLPLVFFIFIMSMMVRSSRMTGENVLSFGRSKAKIVGEDKTGVTFADVAGADEAKEELSEIVEFLKEPERFTALGGKIPKGVLLMGPPGCGKTLLARAVAGEAGVAFFSISGSDFVEMFVGVGAARVRDLFNTAKQKSPCIIFVDEIDAVGRHRGAGLGGGHDEREQTLNQLLVEMDGFDGRKHVIVIAATNRPDILDPALLRPGRFDRHVVLDAPDLRGRESILKIHAKGKPLTPDVDLSRVARRTPGFSGADLSNVMNEAALLAARRRRKDISAREAEDAVERVMAGPERRSRVIGPAEKRVLAYHELGHALVARFTPNADPVHKVSIIPRGRGALGYTLTLPDEDRYILTQDDLLARIKVALGGRSAEEVVFGQKSTGAEDDLQKVTSLTRSIVCRWGMTDALGSVAYQQSPGSPFLGRDMGGRSVEYSEGTAERIDAEVRAIIDRCHTTAIDILTTNRVLLDKLAEILIEHEQLNFDEFEAAVQLHATVKPPPLRLAVDGKGALDPAAPTAPVAEPTA